jgi:hypothetical protein
MRNALHRTLNLALYLDCCLMLGTGLLLTYRLPPGSRGGRGLSVLGYDRHQWGDVHFWLGVGFVTLILLHLAMNWAWMKKIAGMNRRWPLWLGLLAGAAAVAALLLLPVDFAGRGGHGLH